MYSRQAAFLKAPLAGLPRPQVPWPFRQSNSQLHRLRAHPAQPWRIRFLILCHRSTERLGALARLSRDRWPPSAHARLDVKFWQGLLPTGTLNRCGFVTGLHALGNSLGCSRVLRIPTGSVFLGRRPASPKQAVRRLRNRKTAGSGLLEVFRRGSIAAQECNGED